MRSRRSRNLLTAIIALVCLPVGVVRASSNDEGPDKSISTSQKLESTSDNKERLLLGLKDVSKNNNLTKESLVESFFDVILERLPLISTSDYTMIPFSSDHFKDRGYGLMYEVTLSDMPSDLASVRLRLSVDGSFCISEQDMNWWSDIAPGKSVGLGSDGGADDLVYPELHPDQYHVIYMSAIFKDRKCLESLDISNRITLNRQ